MKQFTVEELATELGPVEEVEPGKYRFPKMMRYDSFGTVVVKAESIEAAYAEVVAMCGRDEACCKR